MFPSNMPIPLYSLSLLMPVTQARNMEIITESFFNLTLYIKSVNKLLSFYSVDSLTLSLLAMPTDTLAIILDLEHGASNQSSAWPLDHTSIIFLTWKWDQSLPCGQLFSGSPPPHDEVQTPWSPELWGWPPDLGQPPFSHNSPLPIFTGHVPRKRATDECFWVLPAACNSLSPLICLILILQNSESCDDLSPVSPPC